MTRAYTLQDVVAQLNNQGSTQVDYSITAQINNVYVGIDNVAVSEISSSQAYTSYFYPLNIVQDACPVVYMRFNDPSANPWDSNATGLKNPATPTSITYGNVGFNGNFGGAIGLSKTTTSGVSVPDSTTNFSFASDFSLECWVKTWAFPTGTTKYPIVTKGYSTIGEFAFAIDDGGLPWFNDNALNTWQQGALALSSNTWYYIVFTRSALTGYQFYVNGVQTNATQLLSTQPTHTTHTINYGAADSTSTNAVLLSEVALYERVLTAAQISSHYYIGLNAINEDGYAQSGFVYGNMQMPQPGLPSISKYGTAIYGTSLWD